MEAKKLPSLNLVSHPDPFSFQGWVDDNLHLLKPPSMLLRYGAGAGDRDGDDDESMMAMAMAMAMMMAMAMAMMMAMMTAMAMVMAMAMAMAIGWCWCWRQGLLKHCILPLVGNKLMLGKDAEVLSLIMHSFIHFSIYLSFSLENLPSYIVLL